MISQQRCSPLSYQPLNEVTERQPLGPHLRSCKWMLSLELLGQAMPQHQMLNHWFSPWPNSSHTPGNNWRCYFYIKQNPFVFYLLMSHMSLFFSWTTRLWCILWKSRSFCTFRKASFALLHVNRKCMRNVLTSSHCVLNSHRIHIQICTYILYPSARPASMPCGKKEKYTLRFSVA